MSARHSFCLPVTKDVPGPGFKDLTGQRFHRLTVLQRADVQHGSVRWLCLCDCGTPTRVRGYDLRRGHIRSCGCHRRSVWRRIRAMQCGKVAA